MDFYNLYYDSVLKDVRCWVEKSIDFVSGIIDNYTEDDGYVDMVKVMWDVIEELLISDEVCNNGLDAHVLPEFIDDVIYDEFFQDAMNFSGGMVNLNYLCRGKELGQQYVDCICRTYIIEDNYDAIQKIVLDKFGE